MWLSFLPKDLPPAWRCPEKTPCASTVTVTCGCGRLRQSRRCNAAAASKGPVPQATRGPAVTPLTCDDECARLERNRALASALGVEINPATTAASNISPNTLPYSTETLDLYVQLSSTSPLSTLQTYESTLHSLATSTTQRSVRFQPAKSPLRAFIHSLAADWGFASESFDPEPHRHVFVLKPTTWTAPLLGFGPENSIGVGGKSVGECVKLRERQRLKEREAQRLAAAEAKALKEAAKAQQSTDTASDGGWAQVAASRRSNGVSSARSTTPVASPSPWSGSKFAALAGGDSGTWGLPKKEKLVLRSGVGAAKKNSATPPATEVADNWEEEEEKVEQEEEREREREQQLDGEAQPREENNEMTDATDSVEMPAEAIISTD
ncbi:FKBP12-associated protein 1 [Aspergillus udagawae]|uniref:FKBP12-associated protein 1 n=1 Tax=Aspergillus udagawae TaxID=91492 RepID=A0ABQ1A562_9EURO|nr:FKBP12-associated protein 1 [Aspergillus udagawae]